MGRQGRAAPPARSSMLATSPVSDLFSASACIRGCRTAAARGEMGVPREGDMLPETMRAMMEEEERRNLGDIMGEEMASAEVAKSCTAEEEKEPVEEAASWAGATGTSDGGGRSRRGPTGGAEAEAEAASSVACSDSGAISSSISSMELGEDSSRTRSASGEGLEPVRSAAAVRGVGVEERGVLVQDVSGN